MIIILITCQCLINSIYIIVVLFKILNLTHLLGNIGHIGIRIYFILLAQQY